MLPSKSGFDLHPSRLFPGDYEVSIKFNDEHIPDSPFVVPVASLSDDAHRLTVTSLQVLTCLPAPWEGNITERGGGILQRTLGNKRVQWEGF